MAKRKVPIQKATDKTSSDNDPNLTDEIAQTLQALSVDNFDGSELNLRNFKTAKEKAIAKSLTKVGDLIQQMQDEKIELERKELASQAILSSAVDGIITIDQDKIIRAFNPAAEKLFGYKEKEVIGKNVKMLMPSEFSRDHDQYVENYKRTGQKKIIGKGREVIGLHKQGRKFPIHLSVGESRLDKEGRRLFTGIIRDLTEEKERIRQLELSEVRNRAIVETAVDAIITIDQNRIVQSFNKSAEKMFGYKASEVIGKNVKKLMPKEIASQHDGYVNNYVNTGSKKIIGKGREVTGRKKNGQYFPIFLTVGETKIDDDGNRSFTGILRDISAEKQALEKIQQSEALNRAVIETTLDAVILMDTKRIVKGFNPAAEKMFGFKAEEVVGKNIKILMPKEVARKHDGYVQEYVKSNVASIIGKGRHEIAQRKDGSQFPIHLSIGEAQIDEQGNRIFTGIIKDITDQKKAEEEIQKKQENLEQQNWLKTQVQTILELSQGADEIADLLQKTISRLATTLEAGQGVIYLKEIEKSEDKEEEVYRLYGSYAYQERKNLSNVFKLGEGLIGQCALERRPITLSQVPPDYVRITSGLGDQAPLNIIVVPILFERKCMGVLELATFRSFSELQQELLTQVTNNLGITINNLTAKKQTEVLLVETQVLAEKLQSQQEELKVANEELEEQAHRLKESESKLKSQAEELKTTNEELEEQTQQLTESEERLKVQREELQASNEELEEKSNALKQQKEEIEKAKKTVDKKAEELAMASRYKTEFLANMSHELRTPLNSLLILADRLAKNKEGNLSEKQVEHAEIIHSGGQDLLALINDILDLSKVEAGKLDIRIEAVQFKSIRDSLKSQFEHIATDKNLKFELSIMDDVPDTIRTDDIRVFQILKNLLSNSFKFTERGEVSLSIARPPESFLFNNRHFNEKNSIAFTVRDTGIGISAEKQQLIFEAFQQADGSTSRKYGGTGLGLTISRELAVLLGGEIHLRSEENKGSAFTLILPLEHNESNSLEESSQVGTMSVEQAPLAKMNYEDRKVTRFIPDDRNQFGVNERRLLIIEDDKRFATLIKSMANEKGYKCLVAGSGLDGLTLAKQYLPSAIILDLGLPDIHGYQVLDQLKFDLETRHIPVHVISGIDSSKEAIQKGAIGLLEKPASEVDIANVFERMEQLGKASVRELLIVEDSKNEQKALTALLENKYVNVSLASTGKEALQTMEKRQFDCIIVDLGLPDMDGMDLIKQCNKAKTHTDKPIIIYSGRDLSKEEFDEINQYADSTIIKGVSSPERLLDEVSMFLHSVESELPFDQRDKINVLHDSLTPLEGKKIMLVDDDLRNTYALSTALEDYGLEVTLAENGQHALDQLAKEEGIDIILMDIMMPVMDGYEAMREIRKNDRLKSIPIIALTAKAMPEDKENSLHAGANDYITKPVDIERLVAMVKLWLYAKKGND